MIFISALPFHGKPLEGEGGGFFVMFFGGCHGVWLPRCDSPTRLGCRAVALRQPLDKSHGERCGRHHPAARRQGRFHL